MHQQRSGCTTNDLHGVIIAARSKQIREHGIPSNVGDRRIVTFEDLEQTPGILVPDIHVGICEGVRPAKESDNNAPSLALMT